MTFLQHFLWIAAVSILIPLDSDPYIAKEVASPIHINGRGNDQNWLLAEKLTTFSDPWNDDKIQETSFSALWDRSFFYFLFEVKDRDIVAEGDPANKRGVLTADRVEIFFKSHDGMEPYYCLEMDPWGRVLDYVGHFYRRSDFNWEWPEEDLIVLGTINPSGYVVEGKISLHSLRELGILADDAIQAGIFRGDFSRQEDSTDVRWITWITPESEKPDFHIPSAFGKIAFDP
ncbi:MAG: carbohydrate-binding family 9-like protein [Saprospiraceae bacterium]|nr:carbohydrate-binding family 9-like protein [Saprospiraceae bacterium]